MRSLRQFLVTALITGATACSDSLVTSGGIDIVEITAPNQSLMPGSTMRLRLRLKDKDGGLLDERPATWSTANPAIATVDNSGTVTGIVPGTVIITATCEGVAGSYQLLVAWPTPTVMSVQLDPPALELRSNQSRQFAAIALDGTGNPVLGRPVAWTTANPAVAMVDGGGKVYALAPGQAVLFARVDGATASAAITVVTTVASVQLTPETPTIDIVGDTLRLKAIVRDAGDLEFPGWPVTWTSGNPLVATVDDGGLVTPVSVGTATITGASEGRAGTASVTVARLPVGSVTLSHSAATIGRNQPVQLFATVRAATGRALSGRTVTWFSSNPAVASVSLTGRITGLTPGETTISATVEGHLAAIPVTVSSVSFASISTGGDHTCGISVSGTLYCWGLNSFGQLGVTTIERCGYDYYYGYSYACSTVPLAVSGMVLSGTVAGTDHTCGLNVEGRAFCWGSRSSGQLGDGNAGGRSGPVAVAGGLRFQSLSAGSYFTCGVTTENTGYCWGLNYRGQLGSPGPAQLSPAPISGGLTFASISAGLEHACGVTLGSTVYCWGANSSGQLGDATLGFRSTPLPIRGSLSAVSVTAGGGHTCALTAGGEAHCWGFGEHGALGHGQAFTSTLPIAVAGSHLWKLISAGVSSTCGIDLNDTAWCWGQNGGQIGDGSNTVRLAPSAVSGNLRFAALDVGGTHVCGRDLGDRIYCWGTGGSGQLGLGPSITVQSTPRLLPAQP